MSERGDRIIEEMEELKIGDYRLIRDGRRRYFVVRINLE